MSATKISRRTDGNLVLETFDYRSEFVFDDFAQWISEQLDILPSDGSISEDMEPFHFTWDGGVFEAGWSDEHGCFVGADAKLEHKLKAMQNALAE